MMRRFLPCFAVTLLLITLTGFAFSQHPVSLALQPSIVQSHAAASSGSVASLTNAFSSTNLKGNSIIVVFANGNNNNAAAPISDTNSNTYSKATQIANGTVFEAEIWYATNIAAGANTVTVTPGGSAASIASEIYEVSGLITLSPQVLDQTNSSFGTSTSLSTGAVVPITPNELAFAGFSVGTAAQTITVSSPFTNDSGQQNPATPAGLFSFVSASSTLSVTSSTTAAATIGSEPWAAAIATFRTISVPIQGLVALTLPTAVVAGQQAVTASAVALATNTLTKGICVEALSTNTISVYIGPSGVTTTTGIELPPKASYCVAVTNTNVLYVIASATGASVTWLGN